MTTLEGKGEPFSTYVENGLSNTDVIQCDWTNKVVNVKKTFLITVVNSSAVTSSSAYISKGNYFMKRYNDANYHWYPMIISTGANSCSYVQVRWEYGNFKEFYNGNTNCGLLAENDNYSGNGYKLYI